MKKQLNIFFVNLLKLISIMYVSIILKNILQILLGTIFNSSKSTGLINLRNFLGIETLYLNFKFIFLYDFILLVLFAYFWIYLLLYLVVLLIGNKLWFHVIYMLLLFVLLQLIEQLEFSSLFILIALILGIANWKMFKKFAK